MEPKPAALRKPSAQPAVKRDMRFLLLLAVVAVMIWLGSLLWSMLQSTGNTF